MQGEPLTTIAWNTMVAPVMKLDGRGKVAAFLGTGFVPAASDPVLITARHVIADNPLLEGEKYYVYFQEEDGTEISKAGTADGIRLSSRYDVAAIPLGDVSGVTRLFLDPTETAANEQVACREFSANHFRKDEATGRRKAVLRPRHHLGNVMCRYTSDFPESYPAPCVELSFPALQGSSGAPVIRDRGLHVVAILVANIEQHLMPAQVLRVDGPPESATEEVRYFLPLGKGLRAEAIIEFLQDECGMKCWEPPPMYLPGELV